MKNVLEVSTCSAIDLITEVEPKMMVSLMVSLRDRKKGLSISLAGFDSKNIYKQRK